MREEGKGGGVTGSTRVGHSVGIFCLKMIYVDYGGIHKIRI